MTIGNIKAVIEACNQLSIPYELIDNDFLKVSLHRDFCFVKAAVPVNNCSAAEISKDKDFTYKLLKEVVKMPKTLSFLDPFIERKFKSYVAEESYEEIADSIMQRLEFPLVIKPNRGERSINVFKCNDRVELLLAIQTIFNRSSMHYDYILLAQEYIKIQKEFRVITYKENVELIYRKRKSQKNEDKDLHINVQEFIDPIFPKLNLQFAGYDIALNDVNELVLIEINAKPGLTHYTNKYGLEDVAEIYKKMLRDLAKSVHE